MNVFELNVSFYDVKFVAFLRETVNLGFLLKRKRQHIFYIFDIPARNKGKFTNQTSFRLIDVNSTFIALMRREATPCGLLFIGSQRGSTSDPETWLYFMLLKQC